MDHRHTILCTVFLAVLLLCSYSGITAENEDTLPARLQYIRPAENEALFGARIQRTMTLLATSTESRRNPVSILFWGQSIVRQDWTSLVIEDLQRRFPYANITWENRAIGGFTAPALVRTSVHDLYPVYPDLVVFHVYDGEKNGELERIISNIRRYTTAEILVYTHHVAQFADVGTEEFQKRYNGAEDSAALMRHLAQKYNCELADVREEWKQFVAEQNIEYRDLLKDGIHLNDAGVSLMAALISRHFIFNPLFPNNWADTVRTFEAARMLDEGPADEIILSGDGWKREGATVIGSSKKERLKLTFEGNRVDIITGIADSATLGTARVLIDGKSPSEFPELAEFTRTTTPLKSWMPAIKRVGHRKKLLLEDWTLRLIENNEDASEFTYEVIGSKTGHDGYGSSKELFVSKSGRVVIEPRDFMINPWTENYFKVHHEPGFEVTWSVQPLYKDTYTPTVLESDGNIEMVTVAKLLPKGKHTIEIIPNGDGPVPIRGIRTHNPPLR